MCEKYSWISQTPEATSPGRRHRSSPRAWSLCPWPRAAVSSRMPSAFNRLLQTGTYRNVAVVTSVRWLVRASGLAPEGGSVQGGGCRLPSCPRGPSRCRVPSSLPGCLCGALGLSIPVNPRAQLSLCRQGASAPTQHLAVCSACSLLTLARLSSPEPQGLLSSLLLGNEIGCDRYQLLGGSGLC